MAWTEISREIGGEHQHVCYRWEGSTHYASHPYSMGTDGRITMSQEKEWTVLEPPKSTDGSPPWDVCNAVMLVVILVLVIALLIICTLSE